MTTMTTTATAPTKANLWTLSHTEAMTSLDVKTTRFMRELMESPHVREAWVNRGTSVKPRYFWNAALLSSWFFEACTWRGNESAGKSGSSAGRRPSQAKSGAAVASCQPKTPKHSSATRSGHAKPAGSTGSLLNRLQRPKDSSPQCTRTSTTSN